MPALTTCPKLDAIPRGNMSLPWPDVDAREAFAREIETNFSLLAPAGVGKTYSIVQRILEIARRDPESALPRLVVVTYTRRAAGEMHDRVYNELLASGASPQVIEAMDRAFFGTIHAFCSKLLRLYGLYIGLPAVQESIPHHQLLWEKFLFSAEGESAIGAAIQALGSAARHIQLQQLLQKPPPSGLNEGGENFLGEPFLLPELNFSDLLSEDRVSEAARQSQDYVRKGQQLAAQWLKNFRGETSFLPLPKYSKGGAKFIQAWNATFAPIQDWVQAHVRHALNTIECSYQKQRLHSGQLLYSDQIAFTAELLRHPRAGALLRKQNFSVILDEAQDTDPLQFEVLFEISEGRISMVGDPQQSIYGDRANLNVYREFRRKLCDSPQSRELRYELTFRCRPSILNFVNEAGPELLNAQEGQVEFVPLQSACEGDVGQVLRLSILPGEGIHELSQSKYLVASRLSAWLKETGLAPLRARDWSEVAILCPRKRWLETLALALRSEGLPVQIHSELSFLGDSPVYAWWTSLFWVVTHPTDAFEVAGVLREIFALKDSELAAFCEGDSTRLYATSDASLQPLQMLGRLAEEVQNLPLRSAIQKVLCKTNLLDRLLSLPDEDADSIRNRHEELLIQASDAEARGLTLGEFVQELRDAFECSSESPVPQPGLIQLITCQKAKGLEWDAVIVPYFFRKISFRSADTIFDQEGLLASRRQEMQRLLYVTLTRARNTLVISDDQLLFAAKKPASAKSKTFSFAEILGKAGLRAFGGLPEQAVSGDWKTTVANNTLQGGDETIPEFCLEKTRQIASRFPLKLTPHSLARHSSPKVVLEDTQAPHEILGKDYGIWWHECAEAFSFQSTEWVCHLEKMLHKCPDPERGWEEWMLFSQTALAKRLASGDYLLHTEMPVFFLQGQKAVEGVMDLAAVHHTQNNWLLVDWKTDRVTRSQELLSRYQDQLKTYVDGLRILTTGKVEAGFYAVSLGEWIPLDT